MKTAFRTVALFAAYSTVALVGDYGFGLLADDRYDGLTNQGPTTEASPSLGVSVGPTIASSVQLRNDADCRYSDDRENTVPASSVNLIDIDAGSGELRVEGRAGLDEIIVARRLCASDEDYLDELFVSARVDDGVLSIETNYPDRSGWGSGYARIDLVVLMPEGMAVDIDDSSGEVVVSGTGELTIDDSSGSIDLENVRGALDIDDSSGGLEIRGVVGDIRINDSSGGLDLMNVTGSVLLRDGSGGIDIRDVTGDVVVESDGSGSIEVRDVGGDFRVARDGSGGIRHSGVVGTVDVPQKNRGH